MRQSRVLLLLPLLSLLARGPAAGAPPPRTPLVLTAAGMLTQDGAVLPWPADPGLQLALGAHVRLARTGEDDHRRGVAAERK